MKTATARELRNQFAVIAGWLEKGETVLLTRRGETLGRIIPEPRTAQSARTSRRALFAERFAPLAHPPKRDLSKILADNRGDA